MSGISFKITAPPRASSSSSSVAPSRPSSSASRARPSPATRQDNDPSDSDEDDDGAFGRAARRDSKRRRLADEEVVEFGREGATSKHAKPAPAGPLVIPALPNKDWRKAAEELRAGRPARGGAKKREIYLPETSGGMRMSSTTTSTSGTSTPVTDGADRINAEEAVGGLDMPRRLKRGETEDAIEQVRQEVEVVEVATPPAPAPAPAQERPIETEEQRALRELLSGGEGATEQGPSIEVIYSGKDERNAPIEEADAFKRDVESRPDMASLEDYARVPVGEFGLAMLRGMGWAPGQAASRSGRGAIEAHVPSSRPALLGIGAKPMAEAMGDGGKGKDGKGAKGKGGERKSRREEMRFVPLVKQAREGGGGSGRSTPLTAASSASSRRASRSPPRLAPSVASSRHASRSPPRSSSRRDRDRDRERSPRRDRDHERGGSRYDDHDRRGGSSRRDDRERETDRDRSDRRRDDRDRDRDRDRSDRRRDERDRDDRRTRDERERSREGRRQ